MNYTRHLTQEDLALFALQLLEADELADAVDHLEICEECRHDVARFQGDLVGYALALSEPASPPAAARERLLKTVGKERKAVPERPAPPLRRSSAAVPIAPIAPIVPNPPAAQEFRGERELERLAQRAREMAAQQQEFTDRQAVRGDGDLGGRTNESSTRNPVADGDVYLASRGRRMFELEPHDEKEERPARGRRMFEFEPREEEEERPTRGRNVAASLLGWTGWAIAAGMAVVAGLQFRERQSLQGDVAAVTSRLAAANDTLEQAQSALRTMTDEEAMQVSLHQPVNGAPQPPKPEGHAAYDAQRGALVFIGDHLDPLPAGKTYELWLIQPDNPDGSHKDLVPAGTFKPDVRGVGRVMMPELPKGMAAIGFGVTVENEGGSPKPTSSPVLAGM